MPKTKSRRTSRSPRPRVDQRNKPADDGRTRREGSDPHSSAVISNSVFALTLKDKSWGNLADTMLTEEKDSEELVMYKDLLDCYNVGAELLKISRSSFTKRPDTASAISEILKAFKENICPKGFDLNIDEHYNSKRKRVGYHFTMFKECQCGSWWHFFEIKPIVEDLLTSNPRLHDLFIVFLRSFIYHCHIPSWFDGSMDAHYINGNYVYELRQVLNNPERLDSETLERVPLEQAKQRLADLETTIAEYETGVAWQYQQQIMNAKKKTPKELLRLLKKFPGQSKLVQFMKKACEVMTIPVGVADFCYHMGDGEEYEGLRYDQQVTIIWDWQDHLLGTQANIIDDMARGCEVFFPTLCARIMPGTKSGLDLKRFAACVDWPQRLTEITRLYQNITSRFNNYDKGRNLL
ncbi:MAG TPA: hypothetical protein VK644_14985 [Chitinophagaceae bacterium]|nr:hypothetical protein [Chitinophagaceae bacterium]